MSGDKNYKLIVTSNRGGALKLIKERIAPAVEMDKFCQGPLGVPREQPLMTCPCCGSEDLSAPRIARLAVICWNCNALFRVIGESIEMIACKCSRHDEGRVIKSATREETIRLWIYGLKFFY